MSAVASNKNGKFVTQIQYCTDTKQQAIGFVSRPCVFDRHEGYKWSSSGKKWSEEQGTFSDAVRNLLITSGHPDTDITRTLPVPETFSQEWGSIGEWHPLIQKNHDI